MPLLMSTCNTYNAKRGQRQLHRPPGDGGGGGSQAGVREEWLGSLQSSPGHMLVG